VQAQVCGLRGWKTLMQGLQMGGRWVSNMHWSVNYLHSALPRCMEYKCGAPVDDSAVVEVLAGPGDHEVLAKYKHRMVQSVSGG
jgi:hypothetical protein